MFAVLPHGMAAVAFWRTGQLIKIFWLHATRLSAKMLAPFHARA